MDSADHGFTEADLSDQTGKCFVVTGANSGLGYQLSRALANRGARVVMACRDRNKAEIAAVGIEKDVPKGRLQTLEYDQADLDSIKAAAAALRNEPRIDGLINNAGVMIPPRTETRQGFELQFGVNHLGAFAFTSLLLPKLAETAGSRVVVTGSNAHKAGRIDWNDTNAERGYSKWSRYSMSKLANLLFLFELDRRLRAAGSPIIAVGAHPGFAITDLGRHAAIFSLLKPILALFANSAAMGAWPTLQAAAGPVKPGGYYGPQRLKENRGPSGEASVAPQARDLDAARRLWDKSIELTGIDPGLAPAR